MILLKCPRCGKSAEIDQSLVAEGQRCFTCGVSLEIADPGVAARHAMAANGQLYGLLVGALLGGALVALIGTLGGTLGFAVAAAAAGALLGTAWGFVEGLFAGTGWAALMWDGSWLTFSAKVSMALGAFLGALNATQLANELDHAGVLGVGILGGFLLGGLAGVVVARRDVPSEG